MALDPVLSDIEIALDLYGVAASRFGIVAVGDSALVMKLRKGRTIKKSILREKIHQSLRRLQETGKIE